MVYIPPYVDQQLEGWWYDDKDVKHDKLVEVLSSSSKERMLLEESLDNKKEEEVCIYFDR